MQPDLAHFLRLLRFVGGSLALAAYVGLFLTLAYAAGFFYIEPFRAVRVAGSYWSLIGYDEIKLQDTLPRKAG